MLRKTLLLLAITSCAGFAPVPPAACEGTDFVPTCEQARGFDMCADSEVQASCKDTCNFDGNTKGHGLYDTPHLVPSDYNNPLPRSATAAITMICSMCHQNPDLNCCHNHPHRRRAATRRELSSTGTCNGFSNTRKPYQPSCDTLTLGYDPLKGCQNTGNAFKALRPCSQIEDGSLEACEEWVTTNAQATFEAHKLESSDQVNSMLSTAATIEGSGWGVTAAASAKLVTTGSISSTSLTFALHVSSVKQTKKIKNEQNLLLSDYTLNSIKNYRYEFVDWPSKYIIGSVNYGGSFFGYYSMDKTTKADESELEAMVEISAEQAMFSAEGKVEFNTKASQMSERIIQRQEVSCQGSTKCKNFNEDLPFMDRLMDMYKRWREDYDDPKNVGHGLSFDLQPAWRSNQLRQEIKGRIMAEVIKGDNDMAKKWRAQLQYYEGQAVLPTFMSLVANEYRRYAMLSRSVDKAIKQCALPDQSPYSDEQCTTLSGIEQRITFQNLLFDELDERQLFIHQEAYRAKNLEACVDENCLFMVEKFYAEFHIIYNSVEHPELSKAHAQKFLAGYCTPQIREQTLAAALKAVLPQPTCNGITFEPGSQTYTGREGTQLMHSPSDEISWLVKSDARPRLKALEECNAHEDCASNNCGQQVRYLSDKKFTLQWRCCPSTNMYQTSMYWTSDDYKEISWVKREPQSSSSEEEDCGINDAILCADLPSSPDSGYEHSWCMNNEACKSKVCSNGFKKCTNQEEPGEMLGKCWNP